jgi:cytochrome c oxidase cbb3-type subunit 3
MSAPAISNQTPAAGDPPLPAARKIVHVYDDIEEEDNHLPNWWLAILFGAIVFGFGYWFLYEVTATLPGPLATFRAETAEAAKRRAEAGPVTNESLLVLAKDARTLADGKQLFTSTCAPCHGPLAQGLVGPNLTDKFWLHGGTPVDIHKSITNGYPDKGMRPWGQILGAARVRTVAAFVISLKGQNVPGRPPQGIPVE